MSYILKVTTRYGNPEVNPTVKTWGYKTYEEACKRMVEELEKLNRQIMATDLTNVTGYTIELTEWMGVVVGTSLDIAKIEYDINMEEM